MILERSNAWVLLQNLKLTVFLLTFHAILIDSSRLFVIYYLAAALAFILSFVSACVPHMIIE